MSIGFTHLRSFHAVAETGGFTRAAATLNIGQPTVTTQVKELEQRYGVELFLRRGRRIELTQAGHALRDITRRVMRLCADAEQLLASHGKLLAGDLRLAAVGPFHATEIIAAFRRAHPEVQIAMLLGNSWQTLSHVINLRADVAILAHSAEDARIETVPYSTHEVVVFVNRAHPWFGRRSIRLAELAREPLVLREQGSTTRLALEQAMAQAGLPLRQVLEIGSREGVWKAVEQGLGISAVADFEFVPHPDLCTLRIEDCTIRTEYRIAYLADRRESPRIRAFVAACESLRRAREGATPQGAPLPMG